MNASPMHAPMKRDPYSFSLKKIIQDVEARTGRKFSGPELDGPHHSEPHHPRTTQQMNLEGEPPARPESLDHCDTTKGAGSVPRHMTAPHHSEPPSGRRETAVAPESCAPPKGCDIGHVSTVLSLLPQIPHIGDEAFLFLYLDLSAEFEKRFGVEGWYHRVLTMAAQGRK